MLLNNITRRGIGASLAALMLSSGIASADVKVMASIKPIHSLVATVMEGVGTPTLIVDGSNSPHTYTLRPSDAAALEQAQVIFWVGHELEAFLEKPIDALGRKATIISLIEAPGIKTLPVRDDKNFEAHKEAGEPHDHDGADAHIWLDPENAKAMLQVIAATLSIADSTNAEKYTANATRAVAELDALSTEISATLSPARSKSFIVFHDAYQYFETRFGLKASGAISIHPENPPGAAKLRSVRKRITDEGILCVFAEPQFSDKIVDTILEGSPARKATLDPLGSAIEAGPKHYAMLLKDIAATLRNCLAP